MATAYVFEPSPHHVYRDHPESPARFAVLRSSLDSLGARALSSKAATREEVGAVHTAELIRSIEEACRQGEAIIDLAPTYVTGSSFEDALHAAGATLQCVRSVLSGEASNAFSLARPPGHHAEPQRAMGFCIFNNISIAARDALGRGVGRVAIVDFDAHHGNGTQAAFLEEERVAYLSTHQWGIYPGTGWFAEAPEARKRIVNVPLPAGAGNAAFMEITDTIIDPFIRAFQPGLLLVSAGFDAHWKDPITSLGLSTAGFHRMSLRLVELARELCSGRIVFVLEGGYDPVNLANGVLAVFSALMGAHFTDPADAYARREPDVREHLETIRAWHGF
jgi:acetoin utilization deacetylase AcuC-like enzyme